MPIWTCRSTSRSSREVATVHQRIDVALSGDLLDAVLVDDLGDELIVGLELGQFLLGELAPLAPIASRISVRLLSCGRASLFVADALDIVISCCRFGALSSEDRPNGAPNRWDDAAECKGASRLFIFGSRDEYAEHRSLMRRPY